MYYSSINLLFYYIIIFKRYFFQYFHSYAAPIKVVNGKFKVNFNRHKTRNTNKMFYYLTNLTSQCSLRKVNLKGNYLHIVRIKPIEYSRFETNRPFHSYPQIFPRIWFSLIWLLRSFHLTSLCCEFPDEFNCVSALSTFKPLGLEKSRLCV